MRIVHIFRTSFFTALSWASDIHVEQEAQCQSLLQLRHSAASVSPAVDICIEQANTCFDQPFQALSFKREDTSLAELPENVSTRSSLVSESLEKREAEIVVTRYDEDLRWLDIFAEIPTVVYNRGPRDMYLLPRPRANLRIIDQENKGREDHVMLRHIVEQYDNLPNISIFLQGWPFVHCPGLINTVGAALVHLFDADRSEDLRASDISLFDNGEHGLLPLSQAFWQYSVSDGKLGLAAEIFDLHQQLGDATPALEQAKETYTRVCKTVMGKEECPPFQWVAEGAQWVVTRERIRLTPKHVYEGALRIGEGYESKYRGLVLEALWPVLWSGKYWDPTLSSAVQMDSLPEYANQRAHAQFHCHNLAMSSYGLLYSCHDRMGVCEIVKRQNVAATDQVNSKQLLEMRRHFLIEDETPQTRWSMLAEIEPSLGGAATFAPITGHHRLFAPKLVESKLASGNIQLRPLQQSTDEALQFNISEASVDSTGTTFFVKVASSGSDRYLGCDPSTGNAKLLSYPYKWSLKDISNGFVQFNSHVGQLNLRREDGGFVKCYPIVWDQNKTTSFLINPVPKS